MAAEARWLRCVVAAPVRSGSVRYATHDVDDPSGAPLSGHWMSGTRPLVDGAVTVPVHAAAGVVELTVLGVGTVSARWEDVAAGETAPCAVAIEPDTLVHLRGRLVGDDLSSWDLKLCGELVEFAPDGRFDASVPVGCGIGVSRELGEWVVMGPRAEVPAGQTDAEWRVDARPETAVWVEGVTPVFVWRDGDGILVRGAVQDGARFEGQRILAIDGVSCAELGCLEELLAAIEDAAIPVVLDH